MISELQALMLSADPEADLRAAYAERIAAARSSERRPRQPGGTLRILLAGYSGAANTGADVRTGEIVRQLRNAHGGEPLELGVLVVGTHPLPDWGPVTPERIEGYPPDAVRDLCARYDGVVVCEGSLFTSTFSDSLATLLTAFLGMATAMGKPAVAWGAEADAMSPEIEAFVRAHAAGALLIARNAPSQQRLEALGLEAELGTDTGWSYAPRHPEAADAALDELGWDGQAEILALCPTDPFRWPLISDPARAMMADLSGEPDLDRYRSIYFFQPAEASAPRCAAFLDSLAAAVRDHATQRPRGIFPVIVGMEENDRQACVELAERLGAPAPLIAGERDPDLLVAVLRRATRLISARYHAILLSMAAGVPAVGLAYDQRVPALLAEAGHADLALNVNAPDLAAGLAAKLALLVAEAAEVGADFTHLAAHQQHVQAEMGRRVAAWLTGAVA